jgi:DNA-binding response OmpR family regulator
MRGTPVTRVLIIDDDPAILQLASLSLSFEGMETLTASDAVHGVEMAIEGQPDVIVLDWMLPVMDGLTALRALKDDATTAHIPVVMLTARSSSHDRLDGWLTGASAHVGKPFSLDELTSTVRKLAAMSAADHRAHRNDVLGRLRELA